MTIRPAQAGDYSEIYSLVQTAFATAKVSDGTEQDFVLELRRRDTYRPELELAAEENRQLIGHILLTPLPVSYTHLTLRGVGGVQHQEGDKEHSLVAGLQVLQQLFRLVAVGGKVARNDVHVISGANSFFLFLDLRAVQVGNLALHRLDGLHLVH